MLDYLIKNADVIDGTGKPAFRASVGISGDKIAGVYNAGEEPEASETIDATGLLLTPGFIDIHSHADRMIPIYPQADNKLMQGITTFVGGNCGNAYAPAYSDEYNIAYQKKQKSTGRFNITWKSFGEWLDFCDSLNLGVNYVPLSGHNSLRGSAMGNDWSRVATSEERARMCEMLNEALDSGAFGMTYIADPGQPGHCADNKEYEELFKILEDRGAVVSAHTRHHQNQWPSDDGRNYYGVYVGEPGDVICGRYHGLYEFMELFRKFPKLTAIYSHLTNAFMTPMPHSQSMEDAMLDETLKVFVDDPIKDGQKVYFDVLVHQNSLSGKKRVLTDMMQSLQYDAYFKDYFDEDKLVKALSSSEFRDRLKLYMKSGKYKINMISPATDPYWADCFEFVNISDEKIHHRTLMSIVKEKYPDSIRTDIIYNLCYEVWFDIVEKYPECEWALVLDKREYMATKRLMKHPNCMPMTDSQSFPEIPDAWIQTQAYGNPPLSYTTMVRFLVDMCKSDNVLTREDAVHRMTGLASEVIGLKDRGLIREGLAADLCLIDWNKLDYVIDFNNPSTQPDGIRTVWVNGKIALKDKKFTREYTGRVLRRK